MTRHALIQFSFEVELSYLGHKHYDGSPDTIDYIAISVAEGVLNVVRKIPQDRLSTVTSYTWNDPVIHPLDNEPASGTGGGGDEVDADEDDEPSQVPYVALGVGEIVPEPLRALMDVIGAKMDEDHRLVA